MRALRFPNTKYCSVVALPSLTSWVHCSSGSLIPNALSIANATSRKSRLSMPRSSMAWLCGVIFARSMSQVSEMMLATVSKVEDIGNPLKISLILVEAPDRAHPPAGAGHPSAVLSRAARIAKRFGDNQWRTKDRALTLWNVRGLAPVLSRRWAWPWDGICRVRVSRSFFAQEVSASSSQHLCYVEDV